MKKLIKLFICIILMLVSVYGIHYYYTKVEPTDTNKKGIINHKDDMESLSDLKEKYNNNEIVMFVDIPDVLSLPIVQTGDNDYYLLHDIDCVYGFVFWGNITGIDEFDTKNRDNILNSDTETAMKTLKINKNNEM